MLLTSFALFFCSVFNFFTVISVVEGQIIWNDDELDIDTSCNPPRSGTCMNVWECPFYEAHLAKQKPPRRVLFQIKRNLCGLVDSTTPKVCCPSIISSQQNGDGTDHAGYHLLPINICGPVSFGSRIVNGNEASPREFPWMALIAYQTDEGQDFKCGGSLINERYVLTAAHCLDEKSVLGIRLGEYDLSKDEDCFKGQCEPPVQDMLIDKMIIHEDYDPFTHANDIALVRLAKPVNMEAGNVKPICLPTGNLRQANTVGKTVTVTGWGTTETGHKSSVLSKALIPMVPLENCVTKFGKFSLITKNQICAGGRQGIDSCSGDSGGPLQYIAQVGQSHRYVIDGIVSFGAKQCGLEGWPGVYTNVKEYVTWILDNLKP